MAEPQFLFSEIPLSRAAFDRWLASSVPDAGTSPVPLTGALPQEMTIADALLPYFTAADEEARCLLLHDKTDAVLRCALWLRSEEQRETMLHLAALLAAAGPFMAAGKTGGACMGENISGTLHITKNAVSWTAACADPAFPGWALAWIAGIGDPADMKNEERGSAWVDSKLYNRMKRRYNHYLRNATPQKRIPIKKTELYLSDGTHVVNFQGDRVPGANPLTFRRIANDGMTAIYTDGSGIWIDCFYTNDERRRLAAWLKAGDFEVWQKDCDTPFLLRIRDEVWFLGLNRAARQFELQSLTVDGASFHQITWREFADKDHFYLLDSGNGGLSVVSGLDPAAVRPFDDQFFFTGDQVYSQSELLPGAEAATFRALGGNYYADARHVWYGDTLKPGIDPATFELLDEEHGLARDANHVFMNDTVFPDADAQSVSLVAGGLFLLWRDKNHIWYKDKQLIGADVSLNTPYPWRGSMYCQIGNQVWCGQVLLDGADADSFFITGWDEAEDKYGAWYRDGRCEDE